MSKKLQGVGIAIIVLAVARCIYRIVKVATTKGWVVKLDEKTIKQFQDQNLTPVQVNNYLKGTFITLDVIFAIFVVLVGVFAIRAAKNSAKTGALKVFAVITIIGTLLTGLRSASLPSWISVCFAVVQLALIICALVFASKAKKEAIPQPGQEV